MRSQEKYFQRKNPCILLALPSVEAMRGGRFQLSSTVLKALKCVKKMADLYPTFVVGLAEFDAQTVYSCGPVEGQPENVQESSSNVMKSAALLVLNTALLKICGTILFSHALPTEISLQSWISSTVLGVKNM